MRHHIKEAAQDQTGICRISLAVDTGHPVLLGHVATAAVAFTNDQPKTITLFPVGTMWDISS